VFESEPVRASAYTSTDAADGPGMDAGYLGLKLRGRPRASADTLHPAAIASGVPFLR